MRSDHALHAPAGSPQPSVNEKPSRGSPLTKCLVCLLHMISGLVHKQLPSPHCKPLHLQVVGLAPEPLWGVQHCAEEVHSTFLKEHLAHQLGNLLQVAQKQRSFY